MAAPPLRQLPCLDCRVEDGALGAGARRAREANHAPPHARPVGRLDLARLRRAVFCARVERVE